MSDIRSGFAERVTEVEEYLDLVEAVERSAQTGVPTVGQENIRISALQQKILYAGVYLHLYSLVEATITRCVSAIEDAASHTHQWKPHDLSERIRREWVRQKARTHLARTPENRLNDAVNLCNHLVDMLPVDLSVDLDGGGNWDDEAIFRFASRIGLELQLTESTRKDAKVPIRDDMGPLKLIKTLRNKLAHGEITFGECGEGRTLSELKVLSQCTIRYLGEVIDCFMVFIETHAYLKPESRPESAVQPLDQ